MRTGSERFSLFRRGPLVEETTIVSNISSLLRFLGYLHYEHELSVLDMGVFELDNISRLVLEYVEWLERRRGSRPRSPTDKWQPVSCATVANYLNSLVGHRQVPAPSTDSTSETRCSTNCATCARKQRATRSRPNGSRRCIPNGARGVSCKWREKSVVPVRSTRWTVR